MYSNFGIQHGDSFTGLPDETFLVPLEPNDVDAIETPDQYGFVCDIYFLTHQALYLGMHAAFERFVCTNQTECKTILITIMSGSG